MRPRPPASPSALVLRRRKGGKRKGKEGKEGTAVDPPLREDPARRIRPSLTSSFSLPEREGKREEKKEGEKEGKREEGRTFLNCLNGSVRHEPTFLQLEPERGKEGGGKKKKRRGKRKKAVTVAPCKRARFPGAGGRRELRLAFAAVSDHKTRGGGKGRGRGEGGESDWIGRRVLRARTRWSRPASISWREGEKKKRRREESRGLPYPLLALSISSSSEGGGKKGGRETFAANCKPTEPARFEVYALLSPGEEEEREEEKSRGGRSLLIPP